jgi:hypothetical protein
MAAWFEPAGADPNGPPATSIGSKRSFGGARNRVTVLPWQGDHSPADNRRVPVPTVAGEAADLFEIAASRHTPDPNRGPP